MKAYVFGDDKLIMGSANLDGFSSWINDEAVLQISSKSFVTKFMARIITPDLLQSTPLLSAAVSVSSLKDRVIGQVLERLVD